MSRHRRKRAYRIRCRRSISCFVKRHMPNAPRIHREIVEGELIAGRTVAITGGRYDPLMTFMLWRERGYKHEDTDGK